MEWKRRCQQNRLCLHRGTQASLWVDVLSRPRPLPSLASGRDAVLRGVVGFRFIMHDGHVHVLEDSEDSDGTNPPHAELLRVNMQTQQLRQVSQRVAADGDIQESEKRRTETAVFMSAFRTRLPSRLKGRAERSSESM